MSHVSYVFSILLMPTSHVYLSWSGLIRIGNVTAAWLFIAVMESGSTQT